MADDHGIVLDGLRVILEPEYEVVGEVKDGPALVAAADELRPDVMVPSQKGRGKASDSDRQTLPERSLP